MDQFNQTRFPATARSARLAAFGVHLLTALGVGLALVALLEAVREHWAAMFAWLGAALIVDGIDGPLARRLDVGRLQPDLSGDTLDLVVDYVTYVFVPAYAIAASGLLLPIAAPVLGVGIVMASALYFADRRMKTDDNHFRGFPALWNGVAFYLFLPAIAAVGDARDRASDRPDLRADPRSPPGAGHAAATIESRSDGRVGDAGGRRRGR